MHNHWPNAFAVYDDSKRHWSDKHECHSQYERLHEQRGYFVRCWCWQNKGEEAERLAEVGWTTMQVATNWKSSGEDDQKIMPRVYPWHAPKSLKFFAWLHIQTVWDHFWAPRVELGCIYCHGTFFFLYVHWFKKQGGYWNSSFFLPGGDRGTSCDTSWADRPPESRGEVFEFGQVSWLICQLSSFQSST